MRTVMRDTRHAVRALLRGRAATGATVAAVTVGLSVFGAAGSAQAATSFQWNIAYRGHDAGLYDVTATSKTNAWAVGITGSGSSARPQFMHWNGKAWSVESISNISKFAPTAIGASAADNVWAFGYNGGQLDASPYALIFNGRNWTGKQLPDGFQVGEEAVLSPTSVWAATNQACTITGQSRCTLLVHWFGSGWASVKVPGEVVSAVAANGHAYFLALADVKFGANGVGTGKPVIYEPTTKMNTFPGPDAQIIDQGAGLAVERNGQRYLEGALSSAKHPLRFYHEVGSKWSAIKVPANDCPPGFEGSCPLIVNPSITYDGGNGFWAGYSAHYTGTKWVNTDYFGPSFGHSFATNINAVAPIPGSSSVWGVGAIGSGNSSSESTLVAVNGPLP